MLAAWLQAAAPPTPVAPIMIYPAMTATETDVENPSTFTFSAAAATSEDPVVLGVEGRALKVDDNEFRTSLQRYWLSQNVPAHYELWTRSLMECDLVRKGEMAFCDGYTYRNTVDGSEHTFFLYIGNWPMK